MRLADAFAAKKSTKAEATTQKSDRAAPIGPSLAPHSSYTPVSAGRSRVPLRQHVRKMRRRLRARMSDSSRRTSGLGSVGGRGTLQGRRESLCADVGALFGHGATHGQNDEHQ